MEETKNQYALLYSCLSWKDRQLPNDLFALLIEYFEPMPCIICHGFLEKGAIAHYFCLQDEINCLQYKIEYHIQAKAFMEKYGSFHHRHTANFRPESDPLAREIDHAYNSIVANYYKKLQQRVDTLKIERSKYQFGYDKYTQLNQRYEKCIKLMEAKNNFRMLRYITNECMSKYVDDFDKYSRCQSKIDIYQGARRWVSVPKLEWHAYVLSLSSIYTTNLNRDSVYSYLETMININSCYNVRTDQFLIQNDLCKYAEKILAAVAGGYKK